MSHALRLCRDEFDWRGMPNGGVLHAARAPAGSSTAVIHRIHAAVVKVSVPPLIRDRCAAPGTTARGHASEERSAQ